MFNRLFTFLLGLGFVSTVTGVYVSNLTPLCMRCLCHAASSCNLSVGCIDTYCGSYQFNKEYWKDAGKYVLPDDNPAREGAFMDCAHDFSCAQKTVENYIVRYGNDCNKDGVTDCDDFAMLHFNLKDDCSPTLEGTNFGRRYASCRPKAEPPAGFSDSDTPKRGLG